MKHITLRVGLVGILVLAGCKPKNERIDNPLLARVGTSEIRADEVRQRLAGTGARPEDILPQLVDEYALAERAKQLGLDQKPEILRSYRNLLAGRLREEVLEPALSALEPTEEAIGQYYEQNKDKKYTRSAQCRGALLYVEAPESHPDRRAQGRLRIEQARQDALKQENSPDLRGFGALAATYSEDQTTRYKGGDFGWIAENDLPARWPAQVMKKLFALKDTGEVSDVLEAPEGFFLHSNRLPLALLQWMPQNNQQSPSRQRHSIRL